MSLRLGFLGTGDFAVPSLKALAAAGHELGLVVCQPDRPSGRGHKLQEPPVKRAARELGLEIWQPESLRGEAQLRTFSEARLDLACVVAYGQILPQAVLEAPRLGCLNVHASLLPRWRGAAPIERALAAGDAESGVCVQRMVYRLDAGPVLLSRRRALGPADEAASLHAEFAQAGAELLLQAVAGLERGPLPGQDQDEAAVTLAPLLTKQDGWLDFGLRRGELLRRLRAFKARPGCWVELEGQGRLKVLDLSDAGELAERAEPGLLLGVGDKGFKVACADGAVFLERIQAAGGKPMAAVEFARGRALPARARFKAPGDGGAGQG